MKDVVKTNPHFLKLRPESWWLLLIDPVEHHQGPEKFENEEPGYLRGMFAGLNYILQTLDKPLTADFIVALHDQAISCTYSKHKNSSDLIYLEKFAKGVRHNYAVSFGLVTSGREQNCTKEGFAEILKKLSDGDRTFYINDQSLSFRLDADNIVKPLTEKYINEVWQKVTTLRCSVNTQCQSRQQVLTTLAEKVSQYQIEIQRAQTAKEKIRAIVKFVHDIEFFHSLPDANCRSLGVLLIKKLAIENGFPPVVLPYRDRIDCYSIDQLCEEFEVGIANFEKLQSVPIHPAEAIIYLKDNEQIAAHLVESVLMNLPFWDFISQIDKEGAISLGQTVLLGYDRLTKNELESVLNNIKGVIEKAVYKINSLQSCFSGDGYHKYAICFQNSWKFYSYWQNNLASVKAVKSALQKVEKKPETSLTPEDCHKIAIAVLNDYKESASDLSRRHFSKKASYEFHYFGKASDTKINQRNRIFLQALRALPLLIVGKHKTQLDKLDVPDSRYHLHTMIYFLFEEFTSEEFSELALELQDTMKRESLIIAISQWQQFSMKPLDYAVELYHSSNDQYQNHLLSNALFKLSENPALDLTAEKDNTINKVDPLYQDLFIADDSRLKLPAICH